MIRSRLREPADPALAKASVSVDFDKRLAPYDLAGSLAHAKMLGQVGLVSEEDLRLMIHGLQELSVEVAEGRFEWRAELEDVHMNLEKALTDRIGPAGARLHTARSRNDQVALDERLYLKDVVGKISRLIWELREALVKKAGEVKDTPMPGYTHLQRAQPVLLAHHFLAYYEMLTRDSGRLGDLEKRLHEMPLGSGALSGTGLPIKPELVAQELGFPDLSGNSLDAVASRDLLMEFLAFGAILAVHLSRLAEDMILWCSAEFNLAELPDSLTTSSSMMPQKKNPDGAELLRGKTGRTIGNLVTLLTVVKGLPMSYNRDLQEDKEPLFDTADTLELILPLAKAQVTGLKFNKSRLTELADDPYTPATDLADSLVLKGVPFREAHRQVGALVAYCVEKKISLAETEAEVLKRFCPQAEPDILKRLTLFQLLAARDKTPGGTAPKTVQLRLTRAKEMLAEEKDRRGAG